MKKTRQQIIKARRLELKLSPQYIADHIGAKSRQTIYDYESKDKDITPVYDKWEKLKEILKLQEENGLLVKVSESESTYNLSKDVITVTNVPILSYIQAGEFTDGIDLSDKDIKYIPLQSSEVPKNSFLMEVRGNSMTYDYSPTQRLKPYYGRYSITEGERILVDTNKTAIDDIISKVIVAHDGIGTTVKLVYLEEKGMCLMPLNSRMQNNEEIKRHDEARIIGQVIKVINARNFK